MKEHSIALWSSIPIFIESVLRSRKYGLGIDARFGNQKAYSRLEDE